MCLCLCLCLYLYLCACASQDDCVAPGGEGKPACSPLPGEMGLGGYYGHYQARTPYSLLTPCCTYHAHHAHHAHHTHYTYYTYYQGHWLSATAFLVNATGNATVAAAAERVVEVYASVMEAWRARYGDATTAPCHAYTLLSRHAPLVARHPSHTPGHATPAIRYGDAEDGYLFPYDPLVWDKLLSGHGAAPYYSVPFYTRTLALTLTLHPSPSPHPSPNPNPLTPALSP